MIFIYNQVETVGVQYKESKGKGSLNLVVKGDNILIGSSKEPELKNVLLNKASDKRNITNRLKRIFLSVKGKRLVLDTDTNEFKFIESDKTKDKYNFAQNIIYLVCNGTKVEVKTSEANFVKAPEYIRNEKTDTTVIKLIPKWRAWYKMKEEVILDLVLDGNIVNSFELGWVEDEKGVKSNSLKYRKVEPTSKPKQKKPQMNKSFTNNKPVNDKFKKPFKQGQTTGYNKRKPSETIDTPDVNSRSKYPAKKKKEFIKK